MEHLSAEQILRLLDNAAAPAEQDMIKKHLVACTLCQREVELQESIASSVRSQPLMEPSASFVTEVMAQVAPRRRALPLKLQWASIFAFSVIVVAVGYIFVMGMNNPTLLNGPSRHEQTLVSHGMNSFGDLFTGGIHALTGYLASGSGKMFAGVIFSLGILFLFDGILSRRFTALRR